MISTQKQHLLPYLFVNGGVVPENAPLEFGHEKLIYQKNHVFR
jgi:hypothetical protein